MGKNRIFFARWTPAIYWSLVSKPVSQDIQSICYCLHPGIFRLDTRDLLVAVVPISISSKYLYLYLALKVLTFCVMIEIDVEDLWNKKKKTTVALLPFSCSSAWDSDLYRETSIIGEEYELFT